MFHELVAGGMIGTALAVFVVACRLLCSSPEPRRQDWCYWKYESTPCGYQRPLMYGDVHASTCARQVTEREAMRYLALSEDHREAASFNDRPLDPVAVASVRYRAALLYGSMEQVN